MSLKNTNMARIFRLFVRAYIPYTLYAYIYDHLVCAKLDLRKYISKYTYKASKKPVSPTYEPYICVVMKGFRFDKALHKCEPVPRESEKNSYLNL